MKEGIHPNYRDVCFVDLSNGFKFVTRSCANTKETIKMDDGRELPLFKLDTSSESHPSTPARKIGGQPGRPRREVPQPLRQGRSLKSRGAFSGSRRAARATALPFCLQNVFTFLGPSP
jgi:ribosomal protein L31